MSLTKKDGAYLYHSCKNTLQHINIVQCAFKIIFMEIEHALLEKQISRQWPECEANPAASSFIGLALHVPGTAAVSSGEDQGWLQPSSHVFHEACSSWSSLWLGFLTVLKHPNCRLIYFFTPFPNSMLAKSVHKIIALYSQTFYFRVYVPIF